MPVDRQEARKAAKRELDSFCLSEPCVILDEATEEGETYFVFYWVLRSAADAGSPIAGNAPLLVDRRTGEVFATGTATTQCHGAGKGRSGVLAAFVNPPLQHPRPEMQDPAASAAHPAIAPAHPTP